MYRRKWERENWRESCRNRMRLGREGLLILLLLLMRAVDRQRYRYISLMYMLAHDMLTIFIMYLQWKADA